MQVLEGPTRSVTESWKNYHGSPPLGSAHIHKEEHEGTERIFGQMEHVVPGHDRTYKFTYLDFIEFREQVRRIIGGREASKEAIVSVIKAFPEYSTAP